jgi:hypothetical protein
MEARLKSGIWVKALIRRCDLAAIPIGCSVLTQARGRDGELVWMRATGPGPVAEPDADAYIARQRGRDPDIWVLEIENGSAEPLVDGRII